MTKDEIIKALRDMARYPTVTLPRDSEALKVAADLLAQPQQEPVAFVKGCNRGQWEIFPAKAHQIFGIEQPLYTTPPQRKPLTDEQWMIEMVDAAMVATRDIVPRITRSQCRLIIEAAHGIKE